MHYYRLGVALGFMLGAPAAGAIYGGLGYLLAGMPGLYVGVGLAAGFVIAGAGIIARQEPQIRRIFAP